MTPATPVTPAREAGTAGRTHISLTVRDLERSVEFYEAFFGAPAHKRRPGYANFDVSAPPLKLALQEGRALPGAGPLNHLGILVGSREEVRRAGERLREQGLPVIDEGDTRCCHARQEKIWAIDPDGNRWEVYALLDDLLEGEGAEAGGTVCCQPEPGPVA